MSAVLKFLWELIFVFQDAETYEAVKKLLMQYLKSTFLPARIGSLHGLLYLIQGCLLSNTIIGGISEELQTILPVAVEYVQCNISMNNRWCVKFVNVT